MFPTCTTTGVHDDFPVWSGRFDRELTDVFAIQDEIALGIVNNLRLKLGRGRRRYETSVEAYDLYLRARALPEQRTRGPTSEAARIYQQVIAKDPLFAPAYAGLATAYAASSAQGFKNDHGDDLARMRTAAEKAIQLDPLLAEAHEAWNTRATANLRKRRGVFTAPSSSIQATRRHTVTSRSMSCCRSAGSMRRSTRCGLRRKPTRSHPSFKTYWGGRCSRRAL